MSNTNIFGTGDIDLNIEMFSEDGNAQFLEQIEGNERKRYLITRGRNISARSSPKKADSLGAMGFPPSASNAFGRVLKSIQENLTEVPDAIIKMKQTGNQPESENHLLKVDEVLYPAYQRILTVTGEGAMPTEPENFGAHDAGGILDSQITIPPLFGSAQSIIIPSGCRWRSKRAADEQDIAAWALIFDISPAAAGVAYKSDGTAITNDNITTNSVIIDSSYNAIGFDKVLALIEDTDVTGYTVAAKTLRTLTKIMLQRGYMMYRLDLTELRMDDGN